MSELPPDLPEGITVDDLRYVHPELYHTSMALQGWNVQLGFDIDSHPAKVHYHLARPVDQSFGIEELSKLASDIGITDEEGNNLDGYNLSVDTFDENRVLADIIHDAVNPHIDSSRLLIFDFLGFPTSRTMDTLQALEEAFQPQRGNRLLPRILGKLGLGNA